MKTLRISTTVLSVALLVSANSMLADGDGVWAKVKGYAASAKNYTKAKATAGYNAVLKPYEEEVIMRPLPREVAESLTGKASLWLNSHIRVKNGLYYTGLTAAVAGLGYGSYKLYQCFFGKSPLVKLQKQAHAIASGKEGFLVDTVEDLNLKNEELTALATQFDTAVVSKDAALIEIGLVTIDTFVAENDNKEWYAAAQPKEAVDPKKAGGNSSILDLDAEYAAALNQDLNGGK